MSKSVVVVLLALVAALLATTPGASGASGFPRCRTSGLVIWISAAQGTAGHVYYTLAFTNQSTRTCTLRGYPGVSAVNLSGSQLGSAAGRDTATPVRTITLHNDDSAIATLRIADVGALPAASCGPRDAAGVRVYPPNDRASKIVPLPFKACSTKTQGFMTVRAVQG